MLSVQQITLNSSEKGPLQRFNLHIAEKGQLQQFTLHTSEKGHWDNSLYIHQITECCNSSFNIYQINICYVLT